MCKYCSSVSSGKKAIKSIADWLIYVRDNARGKYLEINCYYKDSPDYCATTNVDINYCPMCGRSLRYEVKE